MSRKITTLISILYYLAFAIVGCLGFVFDKSWFGQGMLVHWCAMALIGILNYINFECLDDSAVFNVIRTIFGFAALVFCSLTFFTGYTEQEIGALSCSFPDALRHAVVFFPLVFILIRALVYKFTAETFEETGNLIVTLILPVVCYAISVLMLVTSVVWGFLALGVVWLAVSVFIKGRLNGFERFLFNLVFYGAVAAVGLSFAGHNVFAVMAFVAASFCFFLFIGIDLFEDTDRVGYWLFNIIGMLGGLVFAVVSLTMVDMGNFEGMQPGIRFAFRDALKNAWLFTPLVYLCLRPPLYKLGKESEWEEGLGDVFVSLLLPVLSYAIAVVALLIGFVVSISVLAVAIAGTCVIWAVRDDYPCVSDVASDIRDSAISITTTITWNR